MCNPMAITKGNNAILQPGYENQTGKKSLHGRLGIATTTKSLHGRLVIATTSILHSLTSNLFAFNVHQVQNQYHYLKLQKLESKNFMIFNPWWRSNDNLNL